MPVRPETQRREEDAFDEPLNGARADEGPPAAWFIPGEMFEQPMVEA
jgi:hypothetical protein